MWVSGVWISRKLSANKLCRDGERRSAAFRLTANSQCPLASVVRFYVLSAVDDVAGQFGGRSFIFWLSCFIPLSYCVVEG